MLVIFCSNIYPLNISEYYKIIIGRMLSDPIVIFDGMLISIFEVANLVFTIGQIKIVIYI